MTSISINTKPYQTPVLSKNQNRIIEVVDLRTERELSSLQGTQLSSANRLSALSDRGFKTLHKDNKRDSCSPFSAMSPPRVPKAFVKKVKVGMKLNHQEVRRPYTTLGKEKSPKKMEQRIRTPSTQHKYR